jgi:hypothetical protein
MEEEVMSQDQETALRYHMQGWSYRKIAKEVFKKQKSYQAVYDMVSAAKKKIMLARTRERWLGRAEACPINEVPLDRRVKKILVAKGVQNLGDAAKLSAEELEAIEGLGPSGCFQVRKLLMQWGVHRDSGSGLYCPKCTRALEVELVSGSTRCPGCGQDLEIQVEALHGQGSLVTLRWRL